MWEEPDPGPEGGGAGGLDSILRGWPHPDCPLPVQGVTLADLKEAEGRWKGPGGREVERAEPGERVRRPGQWVGRSASSSPAPPHRTLPGDPESLGSRAWRPCPERLVWEVVLLARVRFSWGSGPGSPCIGLIPAPPPARAPDGQGQGPQAAREPRRVGKEWRALPR